MKRHTVEDNVLGGFVSDVLLASCGTKRMVAEVSIEDDDVCFLAFMVKEKANKAWRCHSFTSLRQARNKYNDLP